MEHSSDDLHRIIRVSLTTAGVVKVRQYSIY